MIKRPGDASPGRSSFRDLAWSLDDLSARQHRQQQPFDKLWLADDGAIHMLTQGGKALLQFAARRSGSYRR